MALIQINYRSEPVLAIGNDPCATPGKDGPATISSFVNTYFAAVANTTLTSGLLNTTITLGAQGASGASTLVAVGDMLMIIQMQDADINSTNTDSYGDGVSGGSGTTPYTSASVAPPATGASGETTLNNAGRYEFVSVTNVSGGGGAGSIITIKGTGTNKGLNYTYRSATATGTAGQRSYQIIRVPQYSSATLNAGTTAPPWDGSVGGVFAVDVAGQLTLGGTIDMYGKGFRPGAGRKISGLTGSGANTDYRTDTTTLPGKNGSKGEGVAGTPKYVLQYFNPTTLSGTTFNPPTAPTIITGTVEGYPNGSYARGAPGNAGGGSTDGNASNSNDQNSGGGGGANGGDGGNGGRSWSSQVPTGGYGGKAFTTTELDSGRRLLMGGGGGAGTTNDGSRSDSRTYSVGGPPSNNYGTPGTNSTVNISNGIYSSGGAGGGVILLRANTFAGSGTLDLRGITGLSTGQDGAGGGGGGGTAYLSATSSTAGITVNASGGNGGWSTFGDAHGPGGGGGGGVVFRKAAIAGSISSTLTGGSGGQTGLTNNSGFPNHSAVGGLGLAIPIDASDSDGIKTGSQCYPQLTVAKTTSTPSITKPATGTMTATYTITVSNAALLSPATNVVISDALPSGFTFASTTSVTLSAGATRTSTSNPTAGATNPSWGNFTIPEAESVTIVFTVSIPNTQALGTYQNPATATYDDPVRTVAAGTTTATYNSASSTGEDVTIIGTDYGDAPDTYGTDATAGNSSGDPVGASHTIAATNNPFIGALGPDADGTNAATPYNGTGDNVTNINDEDAIASFPAINTATTSYSVTFNATNTSATTANLIGWIDFNFDGKFQSTESATTTVAASSNNVSKTLTWSSISITNSGTTYARFRITTDNAITTSTPGTLASNGEVEDYPVVITNIDYGDAPDATNGVGSLGDYKTRSADGGASHTILNTLRLGTNGPDADDGTLQNAAADADDTNNIDDEDGVTFPTTLGTTNTTYSATVNVFNNTGSARTLVGWVDFNKDGVFAAGEGQTASVPTGASSQSIVLNWSGLSGLTAGNTYARFRISDSALNTSTPNGAVGNGEVEDYQVLISNSDYGDAPDTGTGTGVGNYQTTSSDTGASHTILNTLKLGTNAPDADSGTLQNAAADADDTNNIDDEDGVTPAALTTSSTTYSATVNVFNNTGSARPLVGWVDFNKNGQFESTEGQTASVPSSGSSNIVLNWSGLSGLTAGNTYARFRISDSALTTSTPNGAIGNGEVEDYQITINAVPGLNLVKRITAINATNITGFEDGTDTAGSNDNDTKWPSVNTQYLRGAIACTSTSGTNCNSIKGAKPGDTVEYTIYFLSNGTDNLKNVKICDRIPTNTTFVPDSFDLPTTGKGILLGWDTTGTTLPDPANSTTSSIKVALTNVADVDQGQFYASGSLPTIPCNGTSNPNGGLVVDLGSATIVPKATGSGTPINSYGFVRFKVKVN